MLFLKLNLLMLFLRLNSLMLFLKLNLLMLSKMTSMVSFITPWRSFPKFFIKYPKNFTLDGAIKFFSIKYVLKPGDSLLYSYVLDGLT